jgi:hypothetical protein
VPGSAPDPRPVLPAPMNSALQIGPLALPVSLLLTMAAIALG